MFARKSAAQHVASPVSESVRQYQACINAILDAEYVKMPETVEVLWLIEPFSASIALECCLCLTFTPYGTRL